MAVAERNIQLVISYDGTDFHGWQTQHNLRTVQEEIEQIACRVMRHPVNLIASGRTDAGVHAAGQVANFKTTSPIPAQKIQYAIGVRTPHDISLIRAREVPHGFHSTVSAVSKMYRYRIHNSRRRPVRQFDQRYVNHYWHPLDVERMRAGAARFVGTHDFKALASTRGAERPTYVRTIFSMEVYRRFETIIIDTCGGGFLYNQVRNMVGTLLEVGRGHWAPERIDDIMASRDRNTAGPTAAARGLCLQWVRYPPDHEIADELPSHA